MLVTTNTDGTLECRRLLAADAGELAGLFAALCDCNDNRFFHPHPLSAEAAASLSHYHDGHHTLSADRDEYHVVKDLGGGAILGYGMLRGWAEGFAVPSLGIAVHPRHRGRGIARQFMLHLHRVACGRGARQVRLKVYRDNQPAVRLYESLGYRFTPLGESEWLGIAPLAASRPETQSRSRNRSRVA